MNKSNFKEKIISELDSLNREQQKKMLDYLLSLKLSQLKGTKGKELLAFSGAIGKEDLGAMKRAIAEGCEKVDGNGW
jgi:hypothetical protein